MQEVIVREAAVSLGIWKQRYLTCWTLAGPASSIAPHATIPDPRNSLSSL
jgi:hypothetical protein